jgi:aryl-alcohol dehydrogenase-like predicted oxidoreductase
VEVAGRQARRIGLGCMGMSFSYAPDPASDDPLAVIGAALTPSTVPEATVIDTADVYGPFVNEELVGRALAALRRTSGGAPSSTALVATKVGLVATGEGNRTVPDGRPDRLRAAVEASLRRLGVERLGLLYLHRVDPAVPLEESWGALADLVAAGKAAALGLSEVGVAELTRAARIHPVAAVQSELSLFRRTQLSEVVPWCERRQATFVAYAPLGRGWLTGTIDTGTRFGADDFRHRLPAFAPEALRANGELVAAVLDVAARHDATPGQVALAWLLAQSPAVLAIPGTRRIARLRENLAALDLVLDPADLAALSALPEPTQPRYPEDRR